MKDSSLRPEANANEMSAAVCLAVELQVVWDWLSDMDSNHDKSLQRALCYRYTIGQADPNLAFRRPAAKQKLRCGRRHLAASAAGGASEGLLGLLGHPLLIAPLENGE